MSLRETINREIEGVAEYMAMLYNFTGSPVAYQYMANGKKYALTLTEVIEESEMGEAVQGMGEAVQDMPDSSMESI